MELISYHHIIMSYVTYDVMTAEEQRSTLSTSEYPLGLTGAVYLYVMCSHFPTTIPRSWTTRVSFEI